MTSMPSEPSTEAEWAAKRAGIVWADREKDLLREIDDKISGNVRTSMNNRELQQAIRETFEMWAKAGQPPNSNIEKHFNTLLNLQLIRARGGYVEQ